MSFQVSTTGVLTDASTWKFTRYRNKDGTPRLLESEELKVGLSTSAPDKELRAEIMRIVGVLVAAFEKHADEYERIIQDRMSKRRKVVSCSLTANRPHAPQFMYRLTSQVPLDINVRVHTWLTNVARLSMQKVA